MQTLLLLLCVLFVTGEDDIAYLPLACNASDAWTVERDGTTLRTQYTCSETATFTFSGDCFQARMSVNVRVVHGVDVAKFIPCGIFDMRVREMIQPMAGLCNVTQTFQCFYPEQPAALWGPWPPAR